MRFPFYADSGFGRQNRCKIGWTFFRDFAKYSGSILAPKTLPKLLQKSAWLKPKNHQKAWKVLQKRGYGTFLRCPKCLRKILPKIITFLMVFGSPLARIWAVKNGSQIHSKFHRFFYRFLHQFWDHSGRINAIKIDFKNRLNLHWFFTGFWSQNGSQNEAEMAPKIDTENQIKGQ